MTFIGENGQGIREVRFFPDEAFVKRFWSRVEKGEGCWIWLGGRRGRGYGQAYLPGRIPIGAHRLSWMIANGRYIPDGKVIMHDCDNPPCVRHDHLVLGTQGENLLDMYAKGRRDKPQGECHPRSRLTEEQVLEIRRRYETESCSGLAAEFGVAIPTITRIVFGDIWGHTGDPLPRSRRKKPRVLITASNRTLCRAEWARESGIKESTIRRRLELDWDPEKAVTEPVRGRSC